MNFSEFFNVLFHLSDLIPSPIGWGIGLTAGVFGLRLLVELL